MLQLQLNETIGMTLYVSATRAGSLDYQNWVIKRQLDSGSAV